MSGDISSEDVTEPLRPCRPLTGGPLCAAVDQARAQLADIISEVCGACTKNCCHQGTVLGSADLPRLERWLNLDQDFRDRLARGLRVRARELRQELNDIRPQMVAAAVPSGSAAAALAEWERFCERLDHAEHFDTADLQSLLAFSALRSLTYRLLGTSVRRVRSAPGAPLPSQRCLFHLDGCLAENAKPYTCAGFFCPDDPGLLTIIRERLDCDEFCLACLLPVSPDRLSRLLALQTQRPGLAEPFAVIGPLETVEALVHQALGSAATQLQSTRLSLRSRQLRAEALSALTPPFGSPANAPRLAHLDRVDAPALYDLSLALADRRSRRPRGLAILVIEAFAVPSPVPPKHWRTNVMVQPPAGAELLALSC